MLKIFKHMLVSIASRDTAVRNVDEFPVKGVIATRTEEYETETQRPTRRLSGDLEKKKRKKKKNEKMKK